MSPIRVLPLALLILLAQPAWAADEKAACAASGGTFLTGTVVSGPRFAHGKERRGVELSHTHVRLRGDDGQTYDIAMDDVFADGYDDAPDRVPAPLSSIRPGDRLELCGRPFSSGGKGMDWVHTNCGGRPSRAAPDGWVKVLGRDGSPGPNLEASQEYCRLWRRR
jgi:hypothetical protein